MYLRRLYQYILLKMSIGLAFEVIYTFLKPWLRKKKYESDKKLVTNPTYNLRLVANVVDDNGYDTIRGVRVWPLDGYLKGQQKAMMTFLAAIAKNMANPERERLFLSMLTPEVKHWLCHTNILVEETKAPKRLTYRGLLTEIPSELIPLNIPHYNTGLLNRKLYELGEGFYIQEEKKLPVEIEKRLQSLFGERGYDIEDLREDKFPILWCVDACSSLITPYHLSEEQCFIVKEFKEGNIDVTQLPEQLFALLVTIEVLVEPKQLALKKAKFNQDIDSARESLASKDYLVLKGNFNLIQLVSQRVYIRKLLSGGYFMPCDLQVPNRQGLHNEPFCRFLHFQIVQMIKKVVPEAIIPSFCYLVNYINGSELEKHVDREQCDWNASILLDASPNIGIEDSWPIYLQTDPNDDNTIVEVKLGIGDMLLYRGSRVYHWREKLPQGKTATLCFFHFVKEGFKGSLD